MKLKTLIAIVTSVAFLGLSADLLASGGGHDKPKHKPKHKRKFKAPEPPPTPTPPPKKKKKHKKKKGDEFAAFVFDGVWQKASRNNYVSRLNDNDAIVNGNAMQNVSGNVGLNVTAGQGNLQDNVVSIATAKGTKADNLLSLIKGKQDQVSFNNNYDELRDTNNATLTGYAFQYASGNLGINIAAGQGNLQKNVLRIARTEETGGGYYPKKPKQGPYKKQHYKKKDRKKDGDAKALVFDWVLQKAEANNNPGYVSESNTNTVTVGQFTFRDFSGNLGLNMAAGQGNLQDNVASIATAKAKGADDLLSLIKGDQRQIAKNNMYFSKQDVNPVTLSGQAFLNASGNLGVNIAAGQGNLQKNILRIARTETTGGSYKTKKDYPPKAHYPPRGKKHHKKKHHKDGSDFEAMIFDDVTQRAQANVYDSSGPDDSVTISGDFMGNVSGNVGLNVASGQGNLQDNVASIAVAKGYGANDLLSLIVGRQIQEARDNSYNGFVSGDDAVVITAKITGQSFRDATGNLGINVAAGQGNLQKNILRIARTESAGGYKSSYGSHKKKKHQTLVLQSHYHLYDVSSYHA